MTKRAEYNEDFGLKQQLQRRFKVKAACVRKLSHSLAIYLGLDAQIHVIKCSLKVWIARLDALSLSMCRGTNWYLIFS